MFKQFDGQLFVLHIARIEANMQFYKTKINAYR